MNEQQILATRDGVAALLAAGISIGKVQTNPHADGRAFVLVPQPGGGVKIEYLERPSVPARKRGTVKVSDTDSFITAVKRHATHGTVLYASLHPASFAAVVNDHTAHKDGNAADWRDYRVTFALAHSKECDLWHGRQRKDMSQEEFTFFIEDNLPDFKNPEGAKMLEIALNFRVKNNLSFKSALKLQDGSVDLQYTEQMEGGAGRSGNAKVPETFEIELPVWSGLGAKAYTFEARLRYRVAGGALAIRYELVRPHKVIEQAFKDVLDQIKRGLKDVSVIFGTPE